jgi:hypothetical protein
MVRSGLVTGTPCPSVTSAGCSADRWLRMPGRLRARPGGRVTWTSSSPSGRSFQRAQPSGAEHRAVTTCQHGGRHRMPARRPSHARAAGAPYGDAVDAAVHGVEPPGGDPVLDCARAQPERDQLDAADGAVLELGQPGNRVVAAEAGPQNLARDGSRRNCDRVPAMRAEHRDSAEAARLRDCVGRSVSCRGDGGRDSPGGGPTCHTAVTDA